MKGILIAVIAVVLQLPGWPEGVDRLERNASGRYDVAYKDGRCAVYDNQADSLMTGFDYDRLRYGRTMVEEGLKIVVFHFETSDSYGMWSVIEGSNEVVSIFMSKEDE